MTLLGSLPIYPEQYLKNFSYTEEVSSDFKITDRGRVGKIEIIFPLENT